MSLALWIYYRGKVGNRFLSALVIHQRSHLHGDLWCSDALKNSKLVKGIIRVFCNYLDLTRAVSLFAPRALWGHAERFSLTFGLIISLYPCLPSHPNKKLPIGWAVFLSCRDVQWPKTSCRDYEWNRRRIQNLSLIPQEGFLQSNKEILHNPEIIGDRFQSL